MPERIQFDFPVTRTEFRPTVKLDPERPMRIALLGNFSGIGPDPSGEQVPLGERRPLRIDIDNFDPLFRRMAPRLTLEPDGPDEPPLRLGFDALEDFRPERLLPRVPLLRGLVDLRARLLDPASFAQAAAEMGNGSAGEEDQATVERLLGRAPQPTAPADSERPIDRLLKSIVSPYVTPKPDSRQAMLVHSVEQALSDRIRRLLHAPAFQALEACWRGVHRIVSGLDGGDELRIYLIDLRLGELIADLSGDRPLRDCGLTRLLQDSGVDRPGGQPWSLLAGDFRFDGSEAHLATLARLGELAPTVGGPFLGDGCPTLIGCRGVADLADLPGGAALDDEALRRWQRLRIGPAAHWIGLALPRILLRLPYGARSDEVEGLAFEELSTGHRHEQLLWGSAAFGCAQLLAHAFQEEGWAFQPGDELELDDLPTHIYREQGESRLQACAETYLGERAAITLLDHGLMPFLSFPNRNAVRLARFQSLAAPAATLAGPWG